LRTRRKYLSDPTEEVTTAAENLLADFLREVREIAAVNKKRHERLEAKRLANRLEQERFAAMNVALNGKPPENSPTTDSGNFSNTGEGVTSGPTGEKQELETANERDTGGKHDVLARIRILMCWLVVWQPGQGVKVDHAAIIEILINQLDEERESALSLGVSRAEASVP
jgi:vacuole morphology and inheritance protein 14